MTPTTMHRRGSEAMMVEIPISEQQVVPDKARSLGPLVNWAGALTSLALVVGTGVWSYKLLMRDVSGVPVVRSVEGPMRVQPEEPGGRQAAHQGLSVNSVAADGSAAAPADRLTLAPAPIDLSNEDAKIQNASLPGGETTTAKEARKTDQSDIVAPPPLASGKIEAIEAFAQQIANDVEPLSQSGPADTDPVKVSLGDVEVSEPEAKPEPSTPKVKFTNGVSHSLRPHLRPEGLGKTEKVASATATADAPASVVDAASIPVGTHLVQLGAYASSEMAAEEWTRLSARFSDYLGDKTQVIQEAQSGGRVFYRLRAMGFADLSDARRMCSALKAERADCIPVTVR
ncbi:Sporulation related domain-containing protein [Shimia gijangensis]|uniref:Sporulation related domain-containing protein n=1 Tax=Shimia gijangensis TaxID=1470563 RepID=A0A1M6N347_9RHOB|nr:SPOR domain-containing protein [Shimia gijangensis]SHJ90096.1 Sporulation related domain-containing protein [Shimia gijangensis]